MFKFLKDKLKDALGTFSKKAEDSAETVEIPQALADESLDSLPVVETEPQKPREVVEKEVPAPKEVKEARQKKQVEEPAPEREEFKEILKEEALEAAEEKIIRVAEEEIRSNKTPEQLFEEELAKIKEVGLDVSEEPKEAPVKKEEKGFFSKLKGVFKKHQPKAEPAQTVEKQKPVREAVAALKAPVPETIEPKKGITDIIKEKLTHKVISEKQFEELFMDLEIALLENNVAVEVMEKIKEDLRKVLVNRPILRNKINETVRITLKSSIEQLFESDKVDLLEKIKGKKPYIILFFGVNGSGKTTTIAKLGKMLQDAGLRPLLVAGDTFRAAAIQQLEEHAKKLNIPMVKKDYGSDPAAVAFDAIRYAEAKQFDVVLIDTAGRLHSNTNLLDEMRKIIRVSKPDMKIFIGESITGNDCVEQAKTFNEALSFDAVILSKADVDEKGGAAISITYVTKKPILYIGIGQTYDDLKSFDPKMVTENLGL